MDTEEAAPAAVAAETAQEPEQEPAQEPAQEVARMVTEEEVPLQVDMSEQPEENFLSFYPSNRLRDLRLDELKDLKEMFDRMGCNGAAMPKKPKKTHYQTAVKKDVRKMVAAMTTERQQRWLDMAKVEYADGDNLAELIVKCVM